MDAPKFKEEIKNNPFKLLEEIKMRMYDLSSMRYPFVSLMDQLSHCMGTRQEDEETLANYTKHFKQARDNLKSTVGTEFLKHS